MEGENLQMTDRVIFYEMSYVHDDNEQAIKRVIRRGQTRRVMIHAIYADGTVEQDVFETALENRNQVEWDLKERIYRRAERERIAA
jgi:SNF2 family DNA or RNA helicase